MRKRARTVLCGGRSAMIVPTATVAGAFIVCGKDLAAICIPLNGVVEIAGARAAPLYESAESVGPRGLIVIDDHPALFPWAYAGCSTDDCYCSIGVRSSLKILGVERTVDWVRSERNAHVRSKVRQRHPLDATVTVQANIEVLTVRRDGEQMRLLASRYRRS